MKQSLDASARSFASAIIFGIPLCLPLSGGVRTEPLIELLSFTLALPAAPLSASRNSKRYPRRTDASVVRISKLEEK